MDKQKARRVRRKELATRFGCKSWLELQDVVEEIIAPAMPEAVIKGRRIEPAIKPEEIPVAIAEYLKRHAGELTGSAQAA